MTIFLIIFLYAANLSANTVSTGALSIAELTARSDVIALGAVSSVVSDWNLDRTAIYSRIDLKVDEIFKNTVLQRRISFYQLGGAVGDTASAVGETAAFKQGERVAVFLYKNKEDQLQLVGFYQGKFSIETHLSQGEKAVRRVPGISKPLDELSLNDFRMEIRKALSK